MWQNGAPSPEPFRTPSLSGQRRAGAAKVAEGGLWDGMWLPQEVQTQPDSFGKVIWSSPSVCCPKMHSLHAFSMATPNTVPGTQGFGPVLELEQHRQAGAGFGPAQGRMCFPLAPSGWYKIPCRSAEQPARAEALQPPSPLPSTLTPSSSWFLARKRSRWLEMMESSESTCPSGNEVPGDGG